MGCEGVAFCLEEGIYDEVIGCKNARVGLEDGMHGVEDLVVSCKVVAVSLEVGTDE